MKLYIQYFNLEYPQLKRLLQPKIKIVLLITYPHVVPNPQKLCSSSEHTLKKMIFALCSISLIKMSSYNITLGKNGPNLILLNINNVI